MSAQRRPRLLGVLLAAALAAGCNAVLGIDPAVVDPTLGADAGAAEAASTPADSGTSTANPFTCDAYCDTVARNCTGNNQEYISVATCKEMCKYFEPGVAGERTNDSLACRVYHATEAAKDPITHCQQGGPLAAGTCASVPCASFCTLTFNLCNGIGKFPFPNESECRTACTRWIYRKATDGDAGGEVGDILFASGDSLNCRLYHLESAYEVNNPAAATTHCPHTGDPSSTCN